MKVTHEQVLAIDKALKKKIGINYLDIRVEMTDHIAAAVEEMDYGSFEKNLRVYLYKNKAELKKNYNQYRTNASIKAVKLLVSNIISLRFIMILGLVYSIFYIVCSRLGIEATSEIFQVAALSLLAALALYSGLMTWIKSKRLFSTAERLLPSISGVFVGLFLLGCTMIEDFEVADEWALLYYAGFISIVIIVIFTYRFLIKFYQSGYLVN